LETEFGLSTEHQIITRFSSGAIPNPSRRSGTGMGQNLSGGIGDGTFQAAECYSTGVNPGALVSGGFNGDGKTDLVSADYTDGVTPGTLTRRSRNQTGPGMMSEWGWY
jgi:hypothetical protein